MFSALPKSNVNFSVLLCCLQIFNLDQSKILLFGNVSLCLFLFQTNMLWCNKERGDWGYVPVYFHLLWSFVSWSIFLLGIFFMWRKDWVLVISPGVNSVSSSCKTFDILQPTSVGIVEDLRMLGGSWFNLWARPIFFLRIDDSHCSRIHSPLTAVHCFDDGYMEKQSVAWKEYCAEYL